MVQTMDEVLRIALAEPLADAFQPKSRRVRRCQIGRHDYTLELERLLILIVIVDCTDGRLLIALLGIECCNLMIDG